MKQIELIIEVLLWGMDGGFLYYVGDMLVIVFGFGEIKIVYQVNEYIEVEVMIEFVKIIVFFVMDWCGIYIDGEDVDV